MLFLTGDTHGSFERFNRKDFPEYEKVTRDDYILICGDFGGVWDGGHRDSRRLDFLEARPFTILWVDGNHENFDWLYQYPTEEWHGGKIHRIRSNIIHLMRGQVYDIEGHTFFTMGGASSHDIDDGILDPCASNFEENYWMLRRMGAYFRVNHVSWWKKELPTEEEYNEARRNLDGVNWTVDYIVTHCAPSRIQYQIGGDEYDRDQLTDFLDEVSVRANFTGWYFGHYHRTGVIRDKYHILYKNIVRLF